MDSNPQQTPEQNPTPTVDDLIAQANSQTYVFEHGSQKRSLKQWFVDLPKTYKILLISGTVLFAAVLAFSLTAASSGDKTAISGSGAGSSVTQDTNGDGVIDEKDDPASSQEDTNGDGVIDDYDTADSSDESGDTTSSSAEQLSWWQRLLGVSNGKTSSGNQTSSGSGTDESEVGDYDSTYFSAYDYVYDESSEEDLGYDSAKSAASSGTSATVASWNVLKYDNSVSNVKAGVKDIFSAGATIIGLQEISSPSFTPKSVTAIGSNSIGTYSPGGGSALVWDNKAVEKISADSFRPISSKEKRFAYVKFRHRSSGQQFYVMSLHMQPGVNAKSENCGTDNCKYFKAQMKTLVSKLKQLQSSKLPIIVVGDFNVDYREDSSCKVTWYPCHALGKIDMISSYKALKLKNTTGSAKKYIDMAYFWTASDVKTLPVSNKILGSGSGCKQSKVRDIDGDIVIHCWHGSDHKPILFAAKLGKK